MASTWYIDNRLTTGSNNGTSTANAWRSLWDSAYGTNSGSVAAGDTIEVVAGSGPYCEVTNATSTKRQRFTDLTFSASGKTITTAGGSFTGYVTGGTGYIRISGSANNDGQYNVTTVTAGVITVASTHTLKDEAAGATVTIGDMTPAASAVYVFDQGRHGTVTGGRITWNLNGTVFSAGWSLNTAAFKWTKSRNGTNEFYVTRADGSNPGLVKPESAVVNGWYVIASATDDNHKRGTVGALKYINQYAYGDNDTLGFNTVYVQTNGEAPTNVTVNQVAFVVYAGWNYHTFRNGIWEFGNGSANSLVDGSIVLGRANDMRIERMIGRYSDGQAWELRSPNTQTPSFSSSSGLLVTYTTDIPNFSEVRFSVSGGSLPTGLTAGVSYYTVRVTGLTARLATSLANAAAGTVIAFTDAGSGTLTMLPMQGLTISGSLTYWAGHRGAANTGNGRLTYVNNVDYSSHVGVLLSTLCVSGICDVYNNIFANEEAGAIDKKTAGSTLNEGYNHFYPRMTDPNGNLSNGSQANWATTAATDNPASQATTLATQSSLVNPLFVDFINDYAVNVGSFRLQPTSVCRRTGGTVLLEAGSTYLDYLGVRPRPVPDKGMYQRQ